MSSGDATGRAHVAVASRGSRLTRGPAFTAAADAQELAFREEHEPYPDPLRDVPRFIESKRLTDYLDRVLRRVGVTPHGTAVELGAGICWLSACLAKRPEVERVVAVEFSRRRLERLAPVAIAHLGAPPERIERLLADFHDPGLPDEIADLVVTDAAFHHSADPQRLARAAHRLLRPNGTLLLLREPTLALLRRRRDHGLEGRHGGFEREYDRWEYLRFLRTAGFEATSVRVPGALSTLRGRAVGYPPLSWLNGVLFSEYAYVGRKLRRQS